jgi:hypothetical protein
MLSNRDGVAAFLFPAEGKRSEEDARRKSRRRILRV